MIQALEPLQSTDNFDKFVSMTNDYNQTLAHLAVMFRYFKLRKRLVDWGIDLTIADVNGLIPLHCAYRVGVGRSWSSLGRHPYKSRQIRESKMK